jgi:ABC-type dipeptide/oligopeptide/nickel transport system ATPase component
MSRSMIESRLDGSGVSEVEALLDAVMDGETKQAWEKHAAIFAKLTKHQKNAIEKLFYPQIEYVTDDMEIVLDLMREVLVLRAEVTRLRTQVKRPLGRPRRNDWITEYGRGYYRRLREIDPKLSREDAAQAAAAAYLELTTITTPAEVTDESMHELTEDLLARLEQSTNPNRGHKIQP